MHKGHLAVTRLRDHDIGAVLAVGRIGPEERAQDGRGRRRVLRFLGQSKSDLVDEAR